MSRTILLDVSRCVGCGACVVACQDQNDLYPEQGKPALRRIYQVEHDGRETVIQYFSAGCRHCDDSPCLIGCPTGAIYRDDVTSAVRINRDRCIGCHSCALACPFGVPRYDREDKMYKCYLCSERVEAGLKPACVKVCPFGALRFEEANDVQDDKERAYLTDVLDSGLGASRAER